MCGIVGAVAQRDVAAILLEGLNRLEYRGYDSAGIAIIAPNNHHEIQRIRVVGKVKGLAESLDQNPLLGRVGIAHTRWATHGQPTMVNAHPHCSRDQIIVVHNGIIENHDALRKDLIAKGYQFETETDTEVIGHLIHHHLAQKDDMLSALNAIRDELKGAYALGIINKALPDRAFAIRHGCPLVLGLGIGENFFAPDILALLPVTQRFVFLEEDDIAEIHSQKFYIYDPTNHLVEREIHQTEEKAEATSKGHYRHFMLKEIYEQPKSLIDTVNGHIIDDHLTPQMLGHLAPEILKKIKKVHIIACGTSYHAGLVARYWLEEIADIACQVEVASEYRYRRVVVEPNTLFLTLSQSGETADTLAALRQAKKMNYLATAAISNVAHSSIVREADLIFLTRAGAEIGVAATKTFTAQLAALLLFSLLLAQYKNPIGKMISDLKLLPTQIQQILTLDNQIKIISKDFANKAHALFLGRGALYPIALEGALKLKEISYIHAEAYPAGELKHGPLALIDEEMPVVVVAPNNRYIEKLESNIQEVMSRGGQLYIFADEAVKLPACSQLKTITISSTPEILAPIIYTIPLQLLAYHIAILKGTDVDQPRNLAKSVTVE